MGKPGFIIPYRGFFVNRFHVFIYKIFLIIETLNHKHYSSAQASLPTDAGKRPGCHLRKKLGNPALPFVQSPYPCVSFISLCYIVLLSPKAVLHNFWRHRCAVRNCVRCSIINQREKRRFIYELEGVHQIGSSDRCLADEGKHCRQRRTGSSGYTGSRRCLCRRRRCV